MLPSQKRVPCGEELIHPTLHLIRHVDRSVFPRHKRRMHSPLRQFAVYVVQRPIVENLAPDPPVQQHLPTYGVEIARSQHIAPHACGGQREDVIQFTKVCRRKPIRPRLKPRASICTEPSEFGNPFSIAEYLDVVYNCNGLILRIGYYLGNLLQMIGSPQIVRCRRSGVPRQAPAATG